MTVFLVGAGPGDPGLITRRGAELLGRADVVVYDRLASRALLELVPRGAELVDVGKRPGSKVTQARINDLLVHHGELGRCVVRLKGGDPFVLGRGGEEAEVLIAAGIPFEVVPGVTAAVAVPAYAGIPVTHRGLAESFTVVTGHSASEGSTDWKALASTGGTIVVLMGVAHRDRISERLIEAGLDPETPVAAITWGTRPLQSTVRTSLARLKDAQIASPATIVIGKVASLDLSWFESKPLFGRKVVVTRTRRQASELAERIRGLGGEPIELPVLEIVPPDDGGKDLCRAMAAATSGSYSWIVVTSANAVDPIFDALGAAGYADIRSLAHVKVAAIGPGTAGALERRGLVADLVPEAFVAESLVDAFPCRRSNEAPGVLLPRAEVAREVLPLGLSAKGWEVDVVTAYRSVRPTLAEGALDLALCCDAVAFTASSTVDGFVELMGREAVPPVVVAIGPVTARACHDHGVEVTAVADPHSLDGVVDALAEAFSPGPGPPGKGEEPSAPLVLDGSPASEEAGL